MVGGGGGRRGGEGGGVNRLANLKKGAGTDRTSIFRGGCWERGGDLFQGGCSFYIKYKLNSEIFNIFREGVQEKPIHWGDCLKRGGLDSLQI